MRNIRRTRAIAGQAAFVTILSILAGMTDAIAIGLGQPFVSFASGNTTRFGQAVALGHESVAARLGIALGAFVLGNVLGAVVMSGRSGARSDHGMRQRRLMGLAAFLLAGAWVMPVGSYAALMLLALPMGALNACGGTVDGVALGITYVSGALSKFGLGLGSWLSGAGDRRFVWQIVPWAGLVCGAVLGAGLVARMENAALWVPCAVALGLALRRPVA